MDDWPLPVVLAGERLRRGRQVERVSRPSLKEPSRQQDTPERRTTVRRPRRSAAPTDETTPEGLWTGRGTTMWIFGGLPVDYRWMRECDRWIVGPRTRRIRPAGSDGRESDRTR